MAQFSSELDKLLRLCTARLRIGQGSDQGTGFFVAPGLILTCAHVVEAAQPNMKPVQVDWNVKATPRRSRSVLPSHIPISRCYASIYHTTLAFICIKRPPSEILCTVTVTRMTIPTVTQQPLSTKDPPMKSKRCLN